MAAQSKKSAEPAKRTRRSRSASPKKPAEQKAESAVTEAEIISEQTQTPEETKPAE